MKNIYPLLEGKRIGIVSAHPDDHLIQGHALWLAQVAGAPVWEMTLTKGRRSTINHRPEPAFVADGHREHEGHNGARALGIIANDHLDAPDGRIEAVRAELVPQVGEWIAHHGINLLLTLGGLRDHADHSASGDITRQTAAHLWDTEGYALDILEVQHADEGAWQAHAHPYSQAAVFSAARQHASQMMVSTTIQPDWEAVPGNMWVRPDTLAGLDQYPIRRDATYTLLHAPVLVDAAQALRQ